MFLFTTWALRLFGMSGILGSLLFMLGDLSYNHIPGSKDSPAMKMTKLSPSRLLNAGTLGMVGCWFYALASFHLFLAFRPAGDWFAFILFLAFAISMINYGIGHTAYFAIATGARVAARLGSDVELGGKEGDTFFKRVTFIIYIPVAIFSVMMLYALVTGRSLYPVWMVVFMPIIIYLLRTPLTRVLKGRLKELVNDSYDNFVLFIFFVLSTVVLWNGLIA
jgi:hypothetical protein